MMSARALTDSEWRTAQITEALRRLPPPLSALPEGALCPWCGALHRTVRFGRNECMGCGRAFSFGFPEWESLSSDRVYSWVPFPFREFQALGLRADLLPRWEPNDRLREQYRMEAEEHGSAGRQAGAHPGLH